MLEKKTALVTGAGKGIGRAIALALAKMGVLVIVNYRGSKEQAEETVQKIREMGQEAEAYPCDESDFQAVETMMKTNRFQIWTPGYSGKQRRDYQRRSDFKNVRRGF